MPIPDISVGNQIIANHLAVAAFDNIPSNYIDEVKKMMVLFAGESHSAAYRDGMTLLETQDSTYQAQTSWGFQSYSPNYVRVCGTPPAEGYVTGENRWFTWKAYDLGMYPAEASTCKRWIKDQVDASNAISVLGFGWCWDTVYGGPTATADPVTGNRWYGESDGGPDGNRPWGLDASDYTQTSNRVSMDTYLSATEDYISYCASNNYATKIVFTTGPVDLYSSSGEPGYNVYLKHEYIRNYVNQNSDKILFDYGDIICYDNNGDVSTATWNEHTYPVIATQNLLPEQTGHISNVGAIRLAKAQWWLLARIAGWDGISG